MDKRLFFLLNMAQHKLFRFADQRCQDECGISVTQMGMLMYLKQQPDCQQKQAAAALGLNKPAVTGLVNRLLEQQLIQRSPCPDDGRAMLLSLTPEGLEKVTAAKPLIVELNQQICDDFTEDEINTVLRFLNHLMTRF